MVPGPGRRDDLSAAAARCFYAAGRMAGFSLLAGVALSTLAGVVLLPAYGRLARARYELSCLAGRTRQAEALVAANDHLLAMLPRDEVLTTRLMMSQSNLGPADEMIVIDPAAARCAAPGAINQKRQPLPDPPSGRLAVVAARLENPSTRRGLLLLAAGAMLAAMFLFAPPEMYGKR